jgi:hypothetical protein
MLNVNEVAQLAHEVNRAYCESIGDTSQPSWDSAPDWQKKSAVNGVVAHLNSDLTPEQSHENWLTEKLRDGWVYGDVKDPEKKTHPCIRAYNELPVEQRTKDFLFRGVVHAVREIEADKLGEKKGALAV